MSNPHPTASESESRSLTGGRWALQPADEGVAGHLASSLGLSRLTARALVLRGVTDLAEARRFLSDDLAGLADPSLMCDMSTAVELVVQAVEQGRRIRIYGDYDVDGVCATALLVRALGGLKANVDWYIPHRIDEGYGVNEEAVRKAAEDGVGLLITVDCGSSALPQVALARELGLDVIVTDHHQPGEELPAAPMLNPWRADCAYPFKHLSGVGVAFKLVTALARRLDLPAGQEHRFLDLVCLGTVADVVPLLGENRLIVQHGLRQIAVSKKAGVAALLAAADLSGEITARHVAFVLAPRINAVGRMEHARQAVDLLLTTDPAEARALATELSEQNLRRREEERSTLEEADRAVQAEVDLDREKVIVLGREGWHPGVIGIVASRLVERYHRPALLVSLSDGLGKGSGRSIAAFNLWEALCECAPLLTRFGGHHFAAGFGVEADRLPDFRRRLNEVADARLTMEDLVITREVDAEAELAEVTLESTQELARLAPFGMGNPTPVLVTRNLRVLEATPVGGSGAHLSLRLSDQAGHVLGGIWFGQGELRDIVRNAPAVDVCYRPQTDTWNGNTRVRLFIEDIALRGGSD
jgi:single-stranded-DNA-specific exonuclease